MAVKADKTINISAGHNPDGKIGSGAVGLMKESTRARWVVRKIKKRIQKIAPDITVNNLTVNKGTSQTDILQRLATKHNNNLANINVSVHFNSGRNDTKGDGKTGGIEVYYKNSLMKPIAEKICKRVSALSCTNRGAKYTGNLYFLNHIDNAILIEVCFVDDMDDKKWFVKNKKKVKNRIARALVNYVK